MIGVVYRSLMGSVVTVADSFTDGVATVGVVTKTARKEAESWARIMDMSREAREAKQAADTQALIASLKAEAPAPV